MPSKSRVLGGAARVRAMNEIVRQARKRGVRLTASQRIRAMNRRNRSGNE